MHRHWGLGTNPPQLLVLEARSIADELGLAGSRHCDRLSEHFPWLAPGA
jgi:hypothetical protein